MQLPETLLTVFTAELRERDGTMSVTIPERELEIGDLEGGEPYRIAVLEPAETSTETIDRRGAHGRREPRTNSERPVETGDRLQVEIEDIGEKGDGIARVGPGYIVFVADTDIGDRVTVEITRVRENFGFAEVVEDEPISQ